MNEIWKMKKRLSKITLTFSLFLTLMSFVMLRFDIFPEVYSYVYLSIFTSLLFILNVFIIKKLDFNPRIVWILLGLGVFFRLSVITIPPIGSEDVYRYLWDGKLQTKGINPYLYAPDDKALVKMQSAELLKKMNFTYLKTIYPPVTEVIFAASYYLFGDWLVGFKFILLFFELFTLLLLLLLLRELKIPDKFIGIYSLCPLPVIYFMIDGHLDAIGLPFLLLSVYFFLKAKRLSSYIILGLAIAVKFVAVLLIPLYFLKERKWKKLLPAIIPLLVFFLTYLIYFDSSAKPFETLGLYLSRWYFNGSIVELLKFFTGNFQVAVFAARIMFLVTAGFIYFSKMEPIRKLFYVLFAFFLFNQMVLPWYLSWLLVIVPLNFSWSGILLISLSSLTNLVLFDYKLHKIWYLEPWIMWVEYIPVYLFLFFEFRKSKAISLG